jgi:hypothetical protein
MREGRLALALWTTSSYARADPYGARFSWSSERVQREIRVASR